MRCVSFSCEMEKCIMSFFLFCKIHYALRRKFRIWSISFFAIMRKFGFCLGSNENVGCLNLFLKNSLSQICHSRVQRDFSLLPCKQEQTDYNQLIERVFMRINCFGFADFLTLLTALQKHQPSVSHWFSATLWFVSSSFLTVLWFPWRVPPIFTERLSLLTTLTPVGYLLCNFMSCRLYPCRCVCVTKRCITFWKVSYSNDLILNFQVSQI